jgi:uncharacterized protein YprB with RNaseH-like and TPR domain
MPSADLRSRLQRVRLQKVKRQLPPSVPAERLTQRVEETRTRKREAEQRAALPGREVVTPLGAYQLVENRYPLDFVHGPLPLAALLARDPATAARLARAESLADLRTLAFLDTETTGLAGGAGTLVFLVGVGAIEGDEFILSQYFLRDPGEEEAMLTALVQDLAARAGWVTFNGRAFDLPLLETRLTLNRLRGALGQRPHLDLLFPTRKLYQGRLESCSLGHVEQHVLNILRDQEDVPGELIPQMYQDYLRTRDASEMHRVIYHNAIDILSMVTLAAHLLEVFSTPLALEVWNSEVRNQKSETQPPTSDLRPPTSDLRPPTSNLQPADLLRLARWHDQEGRFAEAESAYRLGLAGRLDLGARREGLMRFAGLLKRQERRAEAAPLWEQWASFSLDDPQPCIELAKYYEWHAEDIQKAVEWAQRALKVVSGWPKGWQRDEATAAVRHRLERLKGKIADGR